MDLIVQTQGTGVPIVGPATYPSSAGSTGGTRGPKGVGSWTKEEDDRLNTLVASFGVKWSQVRLNRAGARPCLVFFVCSLL